MVTDNYPLTYILSTAKLDATGYRWVATLANYNFTITYRSGRLNKDADGLSRQFKGSKTEQIIYPDVLNAVINTCVASEIEPQLAESITVSNTMQVQTVDDLFSLLLKDLISDFYPAGCIKSTALSATDWDQGQNRYSTI